MQYKSQDFFARGQIHNHRKARVAGTAATLQQTRAGLSRRRIAGDDMIAKANEADVDDVQKQTEGLSQYDRRMTWWWLVLGLTDLRNSGGSRSCL